jgi:hypothetical protein
VSATGDRRGRVRQRCRSRPAESRQLPFIPSAPRLRHWVRTSMDVTQFRKDSYTASEAYGVRVNGSRGRGGWGADRSAPPAPPRRGTPPS